MICFLFSTMFLVLITKIKKIRSFFSIFIYLKNIRIFINNKYWITLFVKLEIGQFVFLFFLSLLFFFSFSFIIIIDYRINPFTNIWNVAFCAERLNTGGKNEKKNGVCIDSLYIDALEQLRERMRFISVRFEFIWGRGLWNFSKGFRCFELNSASLTLYDFITDILLRNVSKSSKSWNFSYLLHIFRICQTRKWIVILNNFSSFTWLLLTVDLRFSFDSFGYSRVFTDLFGSFRMRSLLRWLSELFGSCRILSDMIVDTTSVEI